MQLVGEAAQGRPALCAAGNRGAEGQDEAADLRVGFAHPEAYIVQAWGVGRGGTGCSAGPGGVMDALERIAVP